MMLISNLLKPHAALYECVTLWRRITARLVSSLACSCDRGVLYLSHVHVIGGGGTISLACSCDRGYYISRMFMRLSIIHTDEARHVNRDDDKTIKMGDGPMSAMTSTKKPDRLAFKIIIFHCYSFENYKYTTGGGILFLIHTLLPVTRQHFNSEANAWRNASSVLHACLNVFHYTIVCYPAVR